MRPISTLPIPLAALIAVALAVTGGARAQTAERPNVVIVFIDDLGYGDIGPFGATRQRTPNLDRMAREGMKLTSFYAAPVCSVSRAQLLTGCYGARVSVPGVYPPAAPNGLNPAEFTIAERLRERGYATACIGKWHLGDQPEFLPTRQGFDRYFGIPYSNDMQRPSSETGGRVVPLLRDEKVIELLTDEAQSSLVERYTNEAVDFIRGNRERPFLLYLPHTAVHVPIHPGRAFAGKSGNGRYGDWVEEMDWSVGQVLETLRALGLDRRTLVLFTSDNGPWLVKGADGGSAGPLRGGKGSTWEGGVRVPTLAWWPGRIAPGGRSDAVTGTIDVLPTAVALAGGRVPDQPVIDGRDLSPILFGTSSRSPREAHYYFAGYNLQAIRQGRWKLAIAAQPGLAAAGSSSPRLYDLDAEIGEQTDLASRHPEVVATLQALALKMSAEIAGNAPWARRPAGESANPKLLYAGAEARPAPPADLGKLKPGDVVDSASAPQVGGRPFTLSCTIETAEPDAVVLAHGGSALGYALQIRAGKIAFAARTSKEVVTEVSSTAAVTGLVRIKAALAADGRMTLTVNDEPAAVAKAPGVIPRQPREEFCLGHDSRIPVTVYAASGRFRGKVIRLEVTSP